jgi:hypothetical protein
MIILTLWWLLLLLALIVLNGAIKGGDTLLV